MNETSAPVITIDGPSGTGKGTICHMLAEYLGWQFLDSGALYRLLAYAAVKNHVGLDDVNKLAALAYALNIKFAVDEMQKNLVFLDGEDVSREIRSEQCGQNASKIAVIPEVRTALLEKQRAFAISPGLVTDGRDMGTVVFPNAKIKIYLDASIEERAKRRYLQLKENENNASLAQVVDELIKRDARDTARVHSPLMPAKDAVHIDTTGLTIVQVFDNVVQLVEKKMLMGEE